jgi:hypothetical protein
MKRMVLVVAFACTIFFSLAVSPVRHAQQRKTFDLNEAYLQEGAPVEMSRSRTHLIT